MPAIAKTRKLHSDEYYMMCAAEIAKRDGLAQYPGDGPFWAECCRMTEAIYADDKYLTPKEDRIARDSSLTHVERLSKIEALREERDVAERKRRKKADEKFRASMSPEQYEEHQVNAERIGNWLGDIVNAGLEASEFDEFLNPPNRIFMPAEVVKRSFDEHLTQAGRIHVAGLGVRLD